MGCQSCGIDPIYTAMLARRSVTGLGNQLMDETIASIARWAHISYSIDGVLKMANNQVNHDRHGPSTTENSDAGSYYTAPTMSMVDCGRVLGKRSHSPSSSGSSNEYWYDANSTLDPNHPQRVPSEAGMVVSPRFSPWTQDCVQRGHFQYTQETQYEYGARRRYGPSEHHVPASTADNRAPSLYTSNPSYDALAQHGAANQYAAPTYAGVSKHRGNGAQSNGVIRVVPVFESAASSSGADIRPLPGFEGVSSSKNGAGFHLPAGFEGIVSQNDADSRPPLGLERTVSLNGAGIRPPPGLKDVASQNGADLSPPRRLANPYSRWERNSFFTSNAAVSGTIQLQELKARFPNFGTSSLLAPSDYDDVVWFSAAPVELIRQSPKPVSSSPSHADRLDDLCIAAERSKRLAMDGEGNRAPWKTGLYCYETCITLYETNGTSTERGKEDEIGRQSERLATYAAPDPLTPREDIWGAELIRRWKQTRP